MKSIILEKISKELNNGIDTESKVIYILVEIRKVRVLNNHNETKTVLDFYRDWVVHSKLTYSNATQELLGRFQPYIKANISARDIAKDFDKYEPDFFKLKDLKIELEKFLRVNGLPSRLTDNEKCWYKFVRELLKVLKECSIKPCDGKIKELSLEETSDGNTSFKFRLINRRDCPIVKLKWKSN